MQELILVRVRNQKSSISGKADLYARSQTSISKQ